MLEWFGMEGWPLKPEYDRIARMELYIDEATGVSDHMIWPIKWSVWMSAIWFGLIGWKKKLELLKTTPRSFDEIKAFLKKTINQKKNEKMYHFYKIIGDRDYEEKLTTSIKETVAS